MDCIYISSNYTNVTSLRASLIEKEKTMKIEIKLPKPNDNTTEANLIAWHVTVDDVVISDQLLCELEMTGKASYELELPMEDIEGSYKVTELCFDVGDTIQVGETILILEKID